MRTLGLDVGERTVGVAVSDMTLMVAQGLETIRINFEREKLGFERIQELITEHVVDKIVIGLPKNMDGTIGERGEKTQYYGEKLSKAVHIPVVYWDERLSTLSAEKVLITADVSRGKRKKVIDKVAAVVILQNYLDKQNNTKA